MTLVTQEIRENATEISHGDAICQERIKFWLTELGLPNGLLPLKDIEECGYVKHTGFVWIRLKEEQKYNNVKIGKITWYAKEVTAFIEKFKIKRVTGVKTKELMMWITLSRCTIDYPSTGKITFTTSSGFSRSYPMSFFKFDDVKKDVGGVGVAKDA